MPINPLQQLQIIQVISIVYLIFSFIIIIYQVFLNRRQAKVHEQMNELIEVAKNIEVIMLEKKMLK